MGRRLFTFLAGISWLLCIGACVMGWLARGQISERCALARWTPAGELRVASVAGADGRILIGYEHSNFSEARILNVIKRSTPAGLSCTRFKNPSLLNIDVLGANGQRWAAGTQTLLNTDMNVWSVRLVIPAWALAGATAIVPGLWVWLHLKRFRRIDPRLCRSCGYDLRASPARCPECGAMPPLTGGMI